MPRGCAAVKEAMRENGARNRPVAALLGASGTTLPEQGKTSRQGENKLKAASTVLHLVQPQQLRDAIHGAGQLLAQRLGAATQLASDVGPLPPLGAQLGQPALLRAEPALQSWSTSAICCPTPGRKRSSASASESSSSLDARHRARA